MQVKLSRVAVRNNKHLRNLLKRHVVQGNEQKLVNEAHQVHAKPNSHMLGQWRGLYQVLKPQGLLHHHELLHL